ncbi:MAG: hypothetical protein IT368_03840, partial [Candidatus Hydrogenedentes bacterium]|nr:hypothetical protein [Candidatus Hydrogenedentota bacterium]
MPDGHTIAAHHRCGDTDESAEGQPALKIISGKTVQCKGPDGIRSVYAGAERVAVQVSGLRASSRYIFAVAWCEPDEQRRMQRIVLEKGAVPLEILPPARAAAFYKDQPTFARVLFPVPKSDSDSDTLTIAIERSEGPDAVASEFWLLERTEGSPEKRVLI